MTRGKDGRRESARALVDVVGSVLDPELDLPLADLGMVERVEVDRRDDVEVSVRLTTAECPLREVLTQRVRDAVTAARPQTAAVRVAFSIMDEERRREAGATFLARRRSRGVSATTEVLAVASGKGGVGKSSVAANLAVGLALAGKRVGLLDADVWGYSVPQLFGATTPPVAMYETMLPVQAHGVRLMSLGFLVESETPIVWRGPMLHKALTQFVQDVQWGDLDLLVVDLPPGTGDVTLSVAELLPEASLLVVTSPQPAARTVASRVGRMALETSMPISGVVENMSAMVCRCCGEQTPVFGSGGGAQLAAELRAPLLARIPLDLELRQAGDRGEPVVISSPRAPSALALAGLARDLRPVRRSLVGRSLPLTPV